MRRRLYWGATRFLLLDLCSGAGSVQRGMRSYQRRKEWTSKAWEQDGGYPSCSPTLAYVSVDSNAATGADFVMDLTSANLREVISMALAHVGWGDGPNVAVLCWAVRASTTRIARTLVLELTPTGAPPLPQSPPCESYSRCTLGTLSSERFGGPQRMSRQEAYAPVAGPRGDTARLSDALVVNLVGQLRQLHLQSASTTGA